jgi:hypothetical protein
MTKMPFVAARTIASPNITLDFSSATPTKTISTSLPTAQSIAYAQSAQNSLTRIMTYFYYSCHSNISVSVHFCEVQPAVWINCGDRPCNFDAEVICGKPPKDLPRHLGKRRKLSRP